LKVSKKSRNIVGTKEQIASTQSVNQKKNSQKSTEYQRSIRKTKETRIAKKKTPRLKGTSKINEAIHQTPAK
jgi:hypothetical protein